MIQDTDNRKSAELFLKILIPLFVVCALCYSFTLPDWQNSDEPFHYFYIRILFQEHRIPTHEETYQAAHPPGYYFTAAAWTLPFKGMDAEKQLNWIRLLSVLMGTATLLILYRTGKDFFGDSWLGAGMVAFAAVNPMFVATSSVVNNDPAVILACTLAMYVFLVSTRDGGSMKKVVICGVAAGLCCLVKVSANLLPVFFCFYYLFHPRNRDRGIVRVLLELAVFSIVFFAVCSWWFILGYMQIGDKVLFNPVSEISSHPLYIPSNFIWFMKINMMNFWLPNDYLRGAPENLPFVLKLMYPGLSVLCLAIMGYCAGTIMRVKDKVVRNALVWFVFSLFVFLLQMHMLSMQIPVAQARYMFIILSPIAVLIMFPLRRVLGERFPMLLWTLVPVGMALHFVWAFVYFVNIVGPGYDF